MNITDRLLEYIQGITYKDLPAEIVAAGRRSVMDTLGVITAGSNRPGSREIAQLVGEWGGRPKSTLLIYGGKVPAPQAVLANSTMARALDLDDCHVYNRVHPSATVVPVALAAAELRGKVSGPEFLTGGVLGSEITCRLRQVPEYCNPESGWTGEVERAAEWASTKRGLDKQACLTILRKFDELYRKWKKLSAETIKGDVRKLTEVLDKEVYRGVKAQYIK